jgi:hypothetical protein
MVPAAGLSMGRSLRSGSASQPAHHLLACFYTPGTKRIGQDPASSQLFPFGHIIFLVIFFFLQSAGRALAVGGKDDLSGTTIDLKRLAVCVYTLNPVIGTPRWEGIVFVFKAEKGKDSLKIKL